MARHVNIDDVAFMLAGDAKGDTPSPDRSGVKKKAAPGSSRVDRTRAKGGRTATTKGLARAAVVKERINPSTYLIVVKGTRQIVGRVIKQGKNRTSGYGYHLHGDVRTHNGFPSQEAAITRMLTKV